MKKLLTYIFLLCSLSAFAQQDVTKDSSYIEQINGKYYQTRTIERENGNIETTKVLMGEGTALDAYNLTLSAFRQSAKTMANDAAFVSAFPKNLTEIKRQNDVIKALLSKSPLDTIQAGDIARYLLPGWTMKTSGAGAAVDVVFSVTANGQMRHNLGSTPRNVTYFGDAMRLHNYPSSGITTDFFQLNNGNFVTLDRAYILRRPGSNQTLSPRTLKARQ